MIGLNIDQALDIIDRNSTLKVADRRLATIRVPDELIKLISVDPISVFTSFLQIARRAFLKACD